MVEIFSTSLLLRSAWFVCVNKSSMETIHGASAAVRFNSLILLLECRLDDFTCLSASVTRIIDSIFSATYFFFFGLNHLLERQ